LLWLHMDSIQKRIKILEQWMHLVNVEHGNSIQKHILRVI
jgi:hypothetical protein